MPNDENTHPYEWAVAGPPIGYWETEQGTFNCVSMEDITFFRDGTGEYGNRTAFGGREVPIKYYWFFAGRGELYVFDYFMDFIDSDAYEDGSNDPTKPENWYRVNYCASWVSTDCSDKVPILVNCERDGNSEITKVGKGFMCVWFQGVTFTLSLEDLAKLRAAPPIIERLSVKQIPKRRFWWPFGKHRR